MNDEVERLSRLREEFINELLEVSDQIVSLLTDICRAAAQNRSLLDRLAESGDGPYRPVCYQPRRRSAFAEKSEN